MRQRDRLKALNVTRAKMPGMYPDGDGLYLQISEGGAKSWILRYKINKRQRYMGLGPFPTVDLATARKLAAAQRQRIKVEGKDPIDLRRQERVQARLEAAKSVTFKAAALTYIEDNSPGWKNPKHIAQWKSTLETYVFPVFGDVPVSTVDTALVVRALRPIWYKKPETASRLRGRIETILQSAKSQGQRTGDNPASLENIKAVLKPQSKKARVTHHPALPYVEVATFMAELREQVGIAARALEFLILTAARTNEVIGARWKEFDLDNGIWTVPAERMKSKREHRAPLCKRAVAIVKSMDNHREDDSADAYVFPGLKKGRPMSDMAMLALLRRMDHDGITVHGFRSTFKDWVAEETAFDNIISEAALAHVVSDETEAAYRRGTLFQKRGELMQSWEQYCLQKPSRKSTPRKVTVKSGRDPTVGSHDASR